MLQFDPTTGVSDENGEVKTTYTSSEISGIVTATVSGTTANGVPITPGTGTIGVQISALAPLDANANYDLVGATASHGDNHFGKPSFNSSLRTLANNYVAAYPGFKLAYNDMSQVDGGLFDISGGWSRPHGSHRFGNDVDVDISSVPITRRSTLRALAKNVGMTKFFVYGTHLHFRQ